MMFVKWYVSFLFLLTCLTTFAQTHLTIKGKVVDRNSGNALPYASISIPGSSYGTISAESGEFEFFVPIIEKADSVYVSYLGYRTFKTSIADVDRLKVIRLEELATILNEVTISSNGAKELVMNALNAISSIYPTTPYLMEGFHRSWEKVDFTDSISYPGTLIEAAVTIYDPGYGLSKSKQKEEAYINEIRKSALREGWIYNGNILGELLNKNLVHHNKEPGFISLRGFLDFPNDLVYEWEGSTKLNGENLTIVKVELPNKRKFPAYYRIYISDEDHAILRYELVGEKKIVDYSIGEWHTESLHQTYIFKRYQKKPYLSYVQNRYIIRKLDTVRKKVIRTETYFRELLMNNIILTDVDSLREQLKARKVKNVSLALQAKNYNAEFWKTYNIMLENPLDKETIDFFNQKVKESLKQKDER